MILPDLLLILPFAFRSCQLFLFLECIRIDDLTEQFIGVAGKLHINILKSGYTQFRLFRAYVSYFPSSPFPTSLVYTCQKSVG